MTGYNEIQQFQALGLRSSFHFAAEPPQSREEWPIAQTQVRDALALYDSVGTVRKFLMQEIARRRFLWSLPAELEGRARRWKKELADPRQQERGWQ